jgi:hypothetical protein
MVVGLELGARPFDRPSAEPPRRIVLEVTAPTWALFQEARQALTTELGDASTSDSSWFEGSREQLALPCSPPSRSTSRSTSRRSRADRNRLASHAATRRCHRGDR